MGGRSFLVRPGPMMRDRRQRLRHCDKTGIQNWRIEHELPQRRTDSRDGHHCVSSLQRIWIR